MREQGPHDVTLSQRERQVLMEIETQLRRERRVIARAPRLLRSVPGGWAAALLTIGAVVMLLSALAVSLLVALVGGLLLVAGVTLSCLRLAPAFVGWLRRNV